MPRYTIRNKTYGRDLVGTVIHYRGFQKKPLLLRDKGQGFPGGKHLLETLRKRFRSFSLTLTPRTDSIKRVGRRWEVSVSVRTLRRIDVIVRQRSRDLRLDAAFTVLSDVFASHFSGGSRVETYRRGMLSAVLHPDLDARALSAEDQNAVSAFAAKIATDPRAAGFNEREVLKRKHDVQLLHLKNLISKFNGRLSKSLSEGEWQRYFNDHILYFQANYIDKVPKLNIATVTTQFPDFGVVTADSYLDLIEIKLPKTKLLSEDKSHRSFYWTAEIAKAIAQVETYIDSVSSRRADITLQIEKLTKIRLRVIKPRGIVIAGMATEFQGNDTRADYFRLLNEALKNIEIVPYDELSRRLKNTVLSIEKLVEVNKARK